VHDGQTPVNPFLDEKRKSPIAPKKSKHDASVVATPHLYSLPFFHILHSRFNRAGIA
jgi:hypothetical protein